MKEFLFVFRNNSVGAPQGSPEEMQAITQKWMDWVGGIAAQKPADHLHDPDMNQPNMAEFGAMLMSGKILLDTYEGKLQYGKILLNTMLSAMKTERFKAAIDMMGHFN